MEEKRYVHRLPPCPDYDIEGVESWLTDLAKEGLLLEKDTPFFGFYAFEHTTPQTVTYRLEPIVKRQSAWTGNPNEPKPDARALYKDMGWDFITRYGEFFIYRSTDPDPRELHTDVDIQAAAMKVLRKRQWSNLLSSLLILFLQFRFNILSYPVGIVIAMGWIPMFMLYGLCLDVLIHHIRTLRKLQRLSKRIQQGDPMDRKKNWRKGALRQYLSVAALPAIFLFFFASVIWANVQEDAASIPLEDYTGDPPFVTLGDINPAGTYSLESAIIDCETREFSRFLFPVNITWVENADIELADGTPAYAYLNITYHEAANPTLAAMLGDELIRFAARSKDFDGVKTLDIDNDAVTVYTYISNYRNSKIQLRYKNIVMEAQLTIYDPEESHIRDLWIGKMAALLAAQ